MGVKGAAPCGCAKAERERDDLWEALEDARMALIEITWVGITVDIAPYRNNESKMRNIACQAIITANRAILALQATPDEAPPSRASRGRGDT